MHLCIASYCAKEMGDFEAETEHPLCCIMPACSVFYKSRNGACIYISAKCSDISKQTPQLRFMFAISLKYDPLFVSTHELFYKQRHQIWSLHK